jgi:hypothetical protein
MPTRKRPYLKHHRRKINWGRWVLLIAAPLLSVAASAWASVFVELPRWPVANLAIACLAFLALAVYSGALAWSAWSQSADDFRRGLRRALNGTDLVQPLKRDAWPGEFTTRLIRAGLPLAESAALFALTLAAFALYRHLAG